MLKELIKLANNLDAKGLRKEADALDSLIQKMAQEAATHMCFASGFSFMNQVRDNRAARESDPLNIANKEALKAELTKTVDWLQDQAFPAIKRREAITVPEGGLAFGVDKKGNLRKIEGGQEITNADTVLTVTSNSPSSISSIIEYGVPLVMILSKYHEAMVGPSNTLRKIWDGLKKTVDRLNVSVPLYSEN